MTRINVGIYPSELCDQHLLAELRELPRCLAYRNDSGPTNFKLGSGHVLWCARYRKSLIERHCALVSEAKYRGFTVQSLCITENHKDLRWSYTDEEAARPIVIDRIRQRLQEMKREPKWTCRLMPDWALCRSSNSCNKSMMILTPAPDQAMALEGHNLPKGLPIPEAHIAYVQKCWDKMDDAYHAERKGRSSKLHWHSANKYARVAEKLSIL